MEHELVKAITELTERISGRLEATAMIQDVIVSTLLIGLPALGPVMKDHFQQRYDFAPADMSGPALEAFQDRLDSFRLALEKLAG